MALAYFLTKGKNRIASYLFSMQNQSKKPTYLILDLEMTGLDPFRHGVIEFWGAVLDESLSIIHELQLDICPPASCIIDEEALLYNWFTHERIKKGISYDAFCEKFTHLLDTYFPDTVKPIIIGQFITADISFLLSIFSHTDRHDLSMRLGNDIIDTKSIANQENAICRLKWIPLIYKSTSLSKPGWLAETLGVTDYIAHSAMGDIDATRKVLLAFLNSSL